MNAHTIVCGRPAITNRVRASVWAFTHALANVDLAVETLFSITPVSGKEKPCLQHAVLGTPQVPHVLGRDVVGGGEDRRLQVEGLGFRV